MLLVESVLPSSINTSGRVWLLSSINAPCRVCFTITNQCLWFHIPLRVFLLFVLQTDLNQPLLLLSWINVRRIWRMRWERKKTQWCRLQSNIPQDKLLLVAISVLKQRMITLLRVTLQADIKNMYVVIFHTCSLSCEGVMLNKNHQWHFNFHGTPRVPNQSYIFLIAHFPILYV